MGTLWGACGGYSLAAHTWRPRGLSKSVMSRAIIRVTPFGVLTTLLKTDLLSPLGLQVPTLLEPTPQTEKPSLRPMP